MKVAEPGPGNEDMCGVTQSAPVFEGSKVVMFAACAR
jgi:hypothetical protein